MRHGAISFTPVRAKKLAAEGRAEDYVQASESLRYSGGGVLGLASLPLPSAFDAISHARLRIPAASILLVRRRRLFTVPTGAFTPE